MRTLACALALCLHTLAGAQSATPRYQVSWDFARGAQGWRLKAPALPQTQALWRDGALQLDAAMAPGPAGQVRCPVAEASHGFGDAVTRADGDESLTIELEVRRWDLGLGYMDNHAPLLEVVHHGQRTAIPVLGFKQLPGRARLQWRRDAGWQMALGTEAARPLRPGSRPDTSAPQLRLWTDGCSQGMRQSLQVTAVRVSAG